MEMNGLEKHQTKKPMVVDCNVLYCVSGVMLSIHTLLREREVCCCSIVVFGWFFVQSINTFNFSFR